MDLLDTKESLGVYKPPRPDNYVMAPTTPAPTPQQQDRQRKPIHYKPQVTGPSKAFVYNLYRKCDGVQEKSTPGPDSIQNVPNCVVWTVPFLHPSTHNYDFRYDQKSKASSSRFTPMEAIEDCGIYVVEGVMNAVVSTSKRSHVSNMQAQCIDSLNIDMGMISPGDWLFCSMFTDQGQYEDVLRRLNAKPPEPINSFQDGLKFVGRVKTVRRIVSTNPVTGEKSRRVSIVGAGFSEFDTTVYYDPALTVNSTHGEVFATAFLGSLITSLGQTSTTADALPRLVGTLMGPGPKNGGKTNDAPKGAFFVPKTVGRLLNTFAKEDGKAALTYSSVLVAIFGIQEYKTIAGTNFTGSVYEQHGFMPIVTGADTRKDDGSMRLECPNHLSGTFANQMVPWINVPIWGILQNFLMPSINEMYTCLRLDPIGRVLPHFIARQIPFNTERANMPGRALTRFLNLPRWKIEDPLVINYDTCKSDMMRCNYVQVRSQPGVRFEGHESLNRALVEPVWDKADITRNGLYPQFSTTNNLILDADMEMFWTGLIADRSIDGHLKYSGQITTLGTQEPICEGDNLEYDDLVFHIEGLQHQFQVNPNNGHKRFNTTILVSNGVPRNGDLLHPEVYELPGEDAASSQPQTSLE